MYRRKVTVIAAAAVFAIGAAFAAQPTSLRADWGEASSSAGVALGAGHEHLDVGA